MMLITPHLPRITSTPALGTLHQGPMPPWRTDDELEDYKADPKGFLLDRCALWMNKMVVLHNWIITATYYLPGSLDVPNTDRKILLPEKSHDEALWQGKVGLVIGKGRLAFKDNDFIKFEGQDVNIGDWVMYDILEGRQFTIERVHCRRMKDTQLSMILPDPRMIY